MVRISGQFALLPIRNPKTRMSFCRISFANSSGRTSPVLVTASVTSMRLVTRSASMSPRAVRIPASRLVEPFALSSETRRVHSRMASGEAATQPRVTSRDCWLKVTMRNRSFPRIEPMLCATPSQSVRSLSPCMLPDTSSTKM